MARVKAHLSRYERLIGSGTPVNDIVEIRGLKIDKTARRVYVNGEEKNLENSSSFVKTWFGFWAKNARRSNSFVVKFFSSPFT